MGDALLIRFDFDRAGRARFIDSCLDLMDKTAELYALQPGLLGRDVDLLTLDISPAEKYDNFAKRIPERPVGIPPARQENMRLLVAGVIVHERLRQTREWLGFYEGFAGAVGMECLDQFPRLNVRREVVADVYDRVTAQSYPTHVDYALKTSDRAFMMVKTRERFLRRHASYTMAPNAL